MNSTIVPNSDPSPFLLLLRRTCSLRLGRCRHQFSNLAKAFDDHLVFHATSAAWQEREDAGHFICAWDRATHILATALTLHGDTRLTLYAEDSTIAEDATDFVWVFCFVCLCYRCATSIVTLKATANAILLSAKAFGHFAKQAVDATATTNANKQIVEVDCGDFITFHRRVFWGYIL